MSATKTPSPKHYGEFVLGFAYVSPSNRRDDMEPCMWLGRATAARRAAWVIPLSSAYAYADSQTGEPTQYLLDRAISICIDLGIAVCRHSTYKIASAIVDNLPLLVEMPPHAGLTLADIERAADQAGLVVKVNGEEVIDATR